MARKPSSADALRPALEGENKRLAEGRGSPKMVTYFIIFIFFFMLSGFVISQLNQPVSVKKVEEVSHECRKITRAS
jgi:hypothetical protein